MKLNKASSTGGNDQMPPVDGASFSQDAMMSGPDPIAGGEDPNAMGGDPMMGGEDPNAIGGDQMIGGEDPNAMGGDPMMGGEDPNAIGGDQMTGDDPNATGGTGDDTASIINQLSDTDREAVRAYAESMLSRDETAGNGQEQQQPMMERVIFTKGQLTKLHEEFGPNRDYLYNGDERINGSTKKTTKTTSNNSPFNSPKFK